LFKRLENQTDDSELYTRPHVRTVVYINFGVKPACLNLNDFLVNQSIRPPLYSKVMDTGQLGWRLMVDVYFVLSFGPKLYQVDVLGWRR
jgi:hypothetical protein